MIEDAGATLAAISVDPVARSTSLSDDLGLKFPLLSDEEVATVRAYGVEDGDVGVAWPAIFVVDGAGVVRFRSLAETYKVRETPALIVDAVRGLSGNGSDVPVADDATP